MLNFDNECRHQEKIRGSGFVVLQDSVQISWKERRTNEYILETTNQKRYFKNTIRKSQLRFLGQTCRHKEVDFFLSLTGKVEGTRKQR